MAQLFSLGSRARYFMKSSFTKLLIVADVVCIGFAGFISISSIPLTKVQVVTISELILAAACISALVYMRLRF